MALQNFDGMDWYAGNGDMLTAGFTNTAGTPSFNTSGGRYSGGALSTGNNAIGWPIPSPAGEIWCGFGLFSTQTGAHTVAQISSSIGVEMAIYWDQTTNTWGANRGGSTSIGTGTGSNMTTSAWHYIEVHYKLDPSAGIVEIWCDNAQVLNVTGANTRQNASATTASLIIFGGQSSSAAYLFDDLYILDTTGSSPWNTRLGDCKVVTAMPTSDASPNDGTLSTGTSHYAVVDETRTNTTDYSDLTNTTGQGEYFGLTPGLTSAQAVLGVRVGTYIDKSDVGSATFKIGCKSGSTIGYSANLSPATTFAFKFGVFQANPDTSAQWTYSNTNSMVAGLEVV
jgi:hypothetical protein